MHETCLSKSFIDLLLLIAKIPKGKKEKTGKAIFIQYPSRFILQAGLYLMRLIAEEMIFVYYTNLKECLNGLRWR